MLRAAMCPSSGELLYQCDTWFMSLWNSCFIIVSMWHLVYVTLKQLFHYCINVTPGLRHSETAVSEWHKPGVALIQQFSWWWAHGCLKHVQNRNKHTWKTVRQLSSGLIQTHHVGISLSLGRNLKRFPNTNKALITRLHCNFIKSCRRDIRSPHNTKQCVPK